MVPSVHPAVLLTDDPAMAINCPHSPVRRLCALGAAIFGLVTVAVGGRILFGFGEAGFEVVPAVLVFNVVMGAAYIAAAFLIAWSLAWGRMAAGLITLANVLVLVAVLAMRAGGGAVATQTLAAMTLRSGVWLAVYLLLRRERPAAVQPVG